MKKVAIQTRQLQVKYAGELVFWKSGVDQGPQHVKESFNPQFPSDGSYVFHGRMKTTAIITYSTPRVIFLVAMVSDLTGRY